jgi:hypothetical protein
MNIFMTTMSKLADADIASGEDFYDNHFDLKQVPAINP